MSTRALSTRAESVQLPSLSPPLDQDGEVELLSNPMMNVAKRKAGGESGDIELIENPMIKLPKRETVDLDLRASQNQSFRKVRSWRKSIRQLTARVPSLSVFVEVSSSRKDLICRLLIFYALLAIMIATRWYFGSVEWRARVKSGTNFAFAVHPALHSWELTSGSFWILLTCALVALYTLVGIRFAKKLKALFMLLAVGYVVISSQYVKSMEPYESFEGVEPIPNVQGPPTGVCERYDPTNDRFSLDMCSRYRNSSFVSSIAANRYGIDRTSAYASALFLEVVINDIVLTNTLNITGEMLERCSELLREIFCRYVFVSPCSAACEPEFACLDWCVYASNTCPPLFEYLSKLSQKNLQDVQQFVTPAIFEMFGDLIYNVGDVFHTGSCPTLFAVNSTKCTVPFQKHFPRDGGNCSDDTWADVAALQENAEKTWNQTGYAFYESLHESQASWLRRSRTVDIIFYCVVSLFAASFALFFADEAETNGALRLWFNDFQRVHSKASISVFMFLSVFITGGIISAIVVLANQLQSREPFLLLSLSACIQYPLFNALLYLFCWKLAFSGYDLQLEHRQSSRGLFRSDTVKELVETVKQQKVYLGFQKMYRVMERMRKFYKRNLSMNEGRYYIEKLCVMEVFELILQMLSITIAASTQDRALLLSYVVCFLCCNTVTPFLLFKRWRYLAAFSECLFDVFFIALSFAVVLNQVSNKRINPVPIESTQKLTILYPILSCSYISVGIMKTRMLRKGTKGNQSKTSRQSSMQKHRLDRRVRIGELIILFFVVATAWAFSVYIFVITANAEHRCNEKYTSCVWGQAQPKVYFKDGIFAEYQCGVNFVKSLNLTLCSVELPLRDFEQLQRLQLPNRLTEIPCDVAYLLKNFQLRYVNANENGVTSIDWSNCNLGPDLEDAEEQFVALLKKLPNIRTLRLANNSFRSFLNNEAWIYFPIVESIDLSGNLFREVPPSFYQFARLRHVNVRFNRIDSLPGIFAEWAFDTSTSRQVLFGYNPVQHISWHFFHGELSSEIGLLTSLSVLRVDLNTGYNGTLPSELGDLNSLWDLQMSRLDGLHGTLPTQLGRLTNLIELNLHNNINMQSTIPTELGLLTRLTRLEMEHTELYGTLPTELGKLTKLRTIIMGTDRVEHDRFLVGTLPTELGHMTKLRRLDIKGSEIEGTIPQQLHAASNLTLLRVDSRRDLSCPDPCFIDTMFCLTRVYLPPMGLSVEKGNVSDPLFYAHCCYDTDYNSFNRDICQGKNPKD